MLHQDKECHSSSRPGDQAAAEVNHQALRTALDWLLAGIVLEAVRFRHDCGWSAINLIRAALLWVWSEEKTLGERFSHALSIVIRAWGGRVRRDGSYQGFTKILRRWTALLVSASMTVLRRRMEVDLKERFRISGFAVFAVDGSRLELARTKSLEDRFAPQKNQGNGSNRKRRKRKAASHPKKNSGCEKKANSPQMWLTTMWHVGTALPWDWRTGPSGSSEREHMLDMLSGLPLHALVTADAGFVGYEYWKALVDSGRQFVIRVGANVKLLKKLGYARERNGVVYLWPDMAASKNQPPLVLRLVVIHNGKHPMFLVTSVLDENVLSDRQIAEIYSKRWGVELFYRNFKQTFERRKLRSHAADNAEIEAHWSLVGLWAMLLYAQFELAKQGILPNRISTAGVLRAFRRPMKEHKSRPDPGKSLYELLTVAVIDHYQRASKASRAYPRKKQGHAIGAPKIVSATKTQRAQARGIYVEVQKGLAA